MSGFAIACAAGHLNAAAWLVRETEIIVFARPGAPLTGLPPAIRQKVTIVDGPLLGNGDMGVCISAIDKGPRFWLCKNDFWKLSDRALSGGPRVFGGLDVKLPEYGGGSRVRHFLVARRNALYYSDLSQ